jgi:predicted nucleic acid-binding protein
VTYLLDTDWAIDFLRGTQPAVGVVTRLRTTDTLAISVISVGEHYDGAHRRSDTPAEIRGIRRFLRTLWVLGVDEPIARRFAAIRAGLSLAGQTVADLDLLIAATAIDNRIPLLTRNLRHYARIPGLRIYDPTAAGTP